MADEEQYLVHEAVKMAIDDIPATDIAYELDIPLKTVYKILQGQDITAKIRRYRNAGVIGDYLNGMHLLKIATKYSISRALVYKILEKAKVTDRRVRVTPESKQMVLDMYQAGAPILDIVRESRHSTFYIYQLLKANSITLRRAARRSPSPPTHYDTTKKDRMDTYQPPKYAKDASASASATQATASEAVKILAGMEPSFGRPTKPRRVVTADSVITRIKPK